MYRFQYQVMHIPTRAISTSNKLALDRTDILDKINTYNVSGDLWKYWITEEQLFTGEWE